MPALTRSPQKRIARGRIPRWRVGFSVTLVFGLDAYGSRALGEPVAPHQQVVVLQQEGAVSAVGSGFIGALRSHLAELGTALEVRSVRSLDNPIVVAGTLRGTQLQPSPLFYTWIVPYPPKLILYIYEPEGPHLRAREVIPSQSPEAAAEELALILRSAVSAQNAGAALELSELPLPAPPPPPVAKRDPEAIPPTLDTPPNSASAKPLEPNAGADLPPREADNGTTVGPSFGAFTGYVFTPLVTPLFRGDSFQGGPSVRLFVRLGQTRLGVGYVALLPLVLHTSTTEVTLNRHPFQVFAERHFLGTGTRLSGALHFVADPVGRRTLRADPPLLAEPDRTRWHWAAGARLVGELPLPYGLRISLGAGAEVALNPYSIEVARAERRETLASVLVLRPVVDLGLVWTTR